MDIIRIAGIVSDLKIAQGSDSTLFNESEKTIAGIGSIAAAVLQESLSSTSLANISANADIEMEFFTCAVGSEKIRGNFYKVGFENGQYIEFAVSQYAGNEAQAACDPIKHLIWTRPHRTKGYLAQKRSNMIGSVMLSIFVTSFIVLHGFFAGDINEKLRIESAVLKGGLAFVLTMVLCYFVCRRIYDDLIGATLVFDALGFSDPPNVNLPKIHRRAQKIFAAKSGSEDLEDVPWCFRYINIQKNDEI